MFLGWEAKVLNRIYKTSFFNQLVGMFSSLEAFDYREVLSSYCKFANADPDAQTKLLLPTANRLVQKQNSSYDMYPEIVSLGELYRQRQDSDFTIGDVVVASSLSKCKIWPKLYRSNAEHEKLGAIVRFYKRFVESFRDDIDFKFDPAILSVKYTKVMEKHKLKKKTNLAFLKLVEDNSTERIVEEVHKNGEVLCCVEPQMERQPLHVAAEKATLETIKLLVALGANAQGTDKELQTPLFYAVKRGDLQIIKYFVEEIGINIHHEEHQKRNVIYLAAFEGNVDVVKYLHQKGCDINKQSSIGRTPLEKACYLGHVAVVEYLLSVKVDMTLRDAKDRSPLHNAAWGRQGGRDGKKRGDKLVDDSPECVELLLNAGHQIDVPDCDGFTPFFSSVSSNGVRSFHLLIKRGANVNHLTKKGQNACIIAAKYGHLDLLKCLVEQHHLDINLRDSLGISPLEAAAILDYDKPAEPHEYVLQEAFAKEDHLDQPVKCFGYLMRKVFEVDNDKHRAFSFSQFINATLFYKRQDYLVYLLRNPTIQKPLRQAFAKENFKELIEAAINLSDSALKEFVSWMAQQISPYEWQQLINTLLLKGKFGLLKYSLTVNPTKVELTCLQSQISNITDEDLLWELLKLDSDCTVSVNSLAELLTALVMQRRTQTLLRILVPSETAQKRGIYSWDRAAIASVVTRKSQDRLSLIQYCQLNNYKDLSKLLESLATQCLKVNLEELLDFHIPQYEVEVQHRWKKQVIIPAKEVVPLQSLLTHEETDYLHSFAKCKDKAAFIRQEKARIPLVMVDTLPKFDELIMDFQHYNLWGVDIEYYSEQHSFVCTLQLRNINHTYVVDALILRQSIPRLAELFEQPSKLKIFHGCQNDIRWLMEDFSFKTVSIYDTCKAHSLLANDKVSISLKKLAEATLGYRIDKDYQMADWRIRPLLNEMLDYARMDAEVLPYLFMDQLSQAQPAKLKDLQAQCFRQRKLTLRGKNYEVRLK